MVWIVAILLVGQKELGPGFIFDPSSKTSERHIHKLLWEPLYAVARVPNNRFDAVAKLLRRHGIECVSFQPSDPVTKHASDSWAEAAVGDKERVERARSLILRYAKRHGYIKFVLSHPVPPTD